MDINKEKIDELNAVLTVRLEKADYEEKVMKVLNDYKKKARIDGFRPGKVPFGMINKMYRKPVLAEEINKLVSESISKFLVEEKLNILGEPIPHLGEEKVIDWDNDSEFEFKFDLGIAPEVDIQLSTKDKIPFYSIKVDDELIGKYIDSYAQRFGQYDSVDEVTEKDLLKARISQVDSEGNYIDGGILVEESTLTVDLIKDENIKKQVLEAKKGNSLIFTLRSAYPNNVEIAAILKIDKEKAAKIEGDFKIEILDITRFSKAEINQELFDRVFGEGNIKTEKEFRERIITEATKGLALDSEFRLKIDTKELLLKKFNGDIPEVFLKRWLLLINEGKYTTEQIDQDFEHFAEDLKWQLIKDKIAFDNKIVVSDNDLEQGAIEFARMQFAQYGMPNMPDEHLQEFSKRMLEKEEEKNKIKSKITEDKIFEFVKTSVKVEEKEITTEKFNKLFEK
jgi:trigger factor